MRHAWLCLRRMRVGRNARHVAGETPGPRLGAPGGAALGHATLFCPQVLLGAVFQPQTLPAGVPVGSACDAEVVKPAVA